MEDSLVRIDAVRLALEQAVTVQEVKNVIDTVKAAETYARQTKAGKAIELKVSEYIVRAERKLGEMLRAAKAAGQITTQHTRSKRVIPVDDNSPIKLSDVGISLNLSSRAQKLANIPSDTFEQEIATEKASGLVSSKRVISKTGRNGEKPRGNKPRKEHDAAPEVIDLHDKGLTNVEIAAQTGVSVYSIQRTIADENIRRSAEPQITPDMLSMSAQQKFDIAIKQHRKKLDREYEAAVLAAARKYLDTVSTRLRNEQNEAKRIMQGRRGFMTRATYKLILACLHPDWVTDHQQKVRYADAFREFIKLEKFVLSEKESSTDFVKIPETRAEWEALKREVSESRKAKRQKSDLARR
jgi:hypothetical protein